MREEPESHTQDALSALSRRIQRTYKSRVETARRHQKRGNYWNFALVVASLTGTSVAVVSLTDPSVYGERGSALMVVLGIVTLVVSVLVTSAQFQVQAEKFFHAYRSLQKLWVASDLAKRSLTDTRERNERADEIDRDYQSVLDDTDNHSPADFFKAFPGELKRNKPSGVDPADRLSIVAFSKRKLIVLGSNIFTFLPVLGSIALLLLLTPAAKWLLGL
ncbi:SLATT domain-containing protein [Microbacterium sp. LWH13-1.2]|uniref:SLATT domain-containing protein n=1 Tax=Microbacterium sp. LWH13-1.2 TaxID=3135260 RepID=UPI00313A09DA